MQGSLQPFQNRSNITYYIMQYNIYCNNILHIYYNIIYANLSLFVALVEKAMFKIKAILQSVIACLFLTPATTVVCF